jgi:hypothetical protein
MEALNCASETNINNNNNNNSSSNNNNSNNINNHTETEILSKRLHNNSSPEGSPRLEQPNLMDTSVELNGSKSDNQQFCLRWNNHQVRK